MTFFSKSASIESSVFINVKKNKKSVAKLIVIPGYWTQYRFVLT